MVGENLMCIQVDIQKKIGDFSLEVQFQSTSRRIGILGASGCGKSMTLKSIAGIETPDKGKIQIGERVLFDSESRINVKTQQRGVGYLFQNYALFPTMTVEQNIACGLRKKNPQRVREMMEKFRLTGLERRLPGELSGGQQQRTALARIMAYEPGVILLDEPFAALDMFLRDRLQQELLDMLRDYEGTVIMVSHNRDEIYRFSEELLIIDEGKSVIFGDSKELFENPRKKAAAKLTGCKNFSKIERIDEHHLWAPDFGVVLHTEQEIPKDATGMGFRAHEFRPVWGERKENCIKVQIQSEALLPFERQYYLKPEDEKKKEKSAEATDKKKAQGGTSAICWFLQKDQWEEVDRRGMPDYLEFPKEKILFLEE